MTDKEQWVIWNGSMGILDMATIGPIEEGALKPAEINAAFRRLAKTAHPDAGGSDEHYRRIAEARDALLEQFGSAA